MLELMLHCHYVAAEESASLGFPEVTLPVVPGMEGCHWPLRKTHRDNRPKLLSLLLGGSPVRAKQGVGWLVDLAGPTEEILPTVWKIAKGADHGLARREVKSGPLDGSLEAPSHLPPAGEPATDAARKAILDSVRSACGSTLAESLEVQAKHSAEFMTTPWCHKGAVGTEAAKTTVK
jgi:enoyl-CoA hydratase/carnithine racemase